MKRRLTRPRLTKKWSITLAVLAIIIAAAFGARIWYNRNLGPVGSSHAVVYFTVDSGSSVNSIGIGLKRADLIRSSKAFEAYVRSRHLFDKLQAGTYALSQSMSTPQIVAKMANGDVSKNLLTILPGKTLNQIRQAFKQAGYSDTELNSAFNPAAYAGHPALASLPPGASLEGFLYPDSFQKESSTPAQTIIKESLDEMQQHLTPDIVSGFTAQGLNTYQGITLASIVYQESGDPAAEPTVAQVFLSRLKQNIALGSDVTAFYAAQQAGQDHSLGVDSPYNTRLHTGLPPGPIGNVSASALQAVAHPSNTDYLFFVAGDDGVIHFSHTQAEQDAAVKKYCTIQCS